jgi:hypothetical protein
VSDSGWRADVTAGDYFLHQKKQLTVADRRPVIRSASDLVGPGVSANALRLEDFNALEATFNGYFSSERSINGPSVEQSGADAGFDVNPYVGFVSSDAEFGGVQEFTNLTTGSVYRRAFTRSTVLPSMVSWGVWRADHRVTPSAVADTPTGTTVPTGGSATHLEAPSLTLLNGAGTFFSDGSLAVMDQGVYSGEFEVQIGTVNSFNLSITLPNLTGVKTRIVEVDTSAVVPVTFINTRTTPVEVSVLATQTTGVDQTVTWLGVDLVRLGDAI